jgi:hypothetical protein
MLAQRLLVAGVGQQLGERGANGERDQEAGGDGTDERRHGDERDTQEVHGKEQADGCDAAGRPARGGVWTELTEREAEASGSPILGQRALEGRS